jgi:DNA-binding XRE family transcriptional regulator
VNSSGATTLPAAGFARGETYTNKVFLAGHQRRHYLHAAVQGLRIRAIRAELGKRVRDLRDSLSLTQTQLAAKTGISPSFLSMVERGERLPTLATLVALSEATGVTLSQLFCDVHVPKANVGQAGLPFITRLEALCLSPGEVEVLLAVAKALLDRRQSSRASDQPTGSFTT